MPADLSTAIYLEPRTDNKNGNKADSRLPRELVASYRDSAAILRMMLYLKFPYNILAGLGLLVPRFFRDFCYKLFARNRGTIWKKVKYVTGMGDTKMHAYRHVILGLPSKDGDKTTPPLDPSWGFNDEDATDKKRD